MAKKRFVKGVLLGIGIFSFAFFLQDRIVLAGIGFIIAGIWAAVSGLNGADVLILGGLSGVSAAYNNKSLLIIISVFGIAVAAYYVIQLCQIYKIHGKDIGKDKWFELFHEKQLINILLNKFRRMR